MQREEDTTGSRSQGWKWLRSILAIVLVCYLLTAFAVSVLVFLLSGDPATAFVVGLLWFHVFLNR